uniref:Translation initiation factor eIF2B subunit gamma n=1 Tax=Angiostrongylus cantonensis TaxID=6313 RepID=A0A0K0DDJ8_ANGCA
MSELQALLLCSGSGSRMTELCNRMLKCLLPIANVPMFWYPLRTLVNSGVKGTIILHSRESLVLRLQCTGFHRSL